MPLFTLPDLADLQPAPPVPAAPDTVFTDLAASSLHALDAVSLDLAGAQSDLTVNVAREGQRAGALGQDLATGQQAFNALSADLDSVDLSPALTAAQANEAFIDQGARDASQLGGSANITNQVPDIGTAPDVPQPPLQPPPPPPPPPGGGGSGPVAIVCPPGELLDPLSGTCFVPEINVQACSFGEQFDPLTGSCANPLDFLCPAGEVIDPFSGACIPESIAPTNF